MQDDIDLGAAMAPKSAPLIPEIVEDALPSLPFPSGFDLSPIALTLVPYECHVALMVKEAKSITVNDAASQKVAVSATARNKKLWRKLEDERERARRPYLDHLGNIQNIFKTLQDPLLGNIRTIKDEQGKYDHQLEMERRAREAAAREEQRKLQAKLDAEAREQRLEAERKAKEAAEKLKAETDEATRIALEKEIAEETAAAQAPTPQAPLMTEKQEVVRTTEGSSYTKFVWKCRIVNAEQVPREYCMPDQKLLDVAVKGGVRNIAGCVIEEVAVPVTRV